MTREFDRSIGDGLSVNEPKKQYIMNLSTLSTDDTFIQKEKQKQESWFLKKINDAVGWGSSEKPADKPAADKPADKPVEEDVAELNFSAPKSAAGSAAAKASPEAVTADAPPPEKAAPHDVAELNSSAPKSAAVTAAEATPASPVDDNVAELFFSAPKTGPTTATAAPIAGPAVVNNEASTHGSMHGVSQYLNSPATLGVSVGLIILFVAFMLRRRRQNQQYLKTGSENKPLIHGNNERQSKRTNDSDEEDL